MPAANASGCHGLRQGHRGLLWLLLVACGLHLAFLPSESAIISKVQVCKTNGEKDIDKENCVKQSHINLDVQSGLKSYDYVVRSIDDPNKGLYIHIYTATTTLSYPLVYIADAPLYYKEHNVAKTYAEMHGQCDDCEKMEHPKCTKIENIPPYLRKDFKEKVCCCCNKNAKDGSPRADFNCASLFGFIMVGNCTSMSCLEVVGPWYSLFKPQNPPDIHRRMFVDVYAFDGDKGIIPDVAKKGYVAEADSPEDLLYFKQPVYKDGHFKFILNKAQRFAKNAELDFEITLVKSGLVDGNAPKNLDKVLAVPSWPQSHPTVQGSSWKHDCIDPTWEEGEEDCDDDEDGRDCIMERCAYNIRAIEPDAVDTTGVLCDKIGISMGAWANEARLCNTAPGTCIQNQLGWYLKEKGSSAKLPRIYGSTPLVARKLIKREDGVKSENEWLDRNVIQSIGYALNEPDISRVEIYTFTATLVEIISDVTGFIINASIAETCMIASEETCYLTVVTKNAGKISAPYHHRVKCFEEDKEDVVVAISKEQRVDINANATATSKIPLEFLHTDVIKPLFCNVELYSGGKDLLESVRISMKLNAPKPTIGMNSRSFDSETNTESDRIGSKGGVSLKSGGGTCNCTGFAVLCFFNNFSGCMRHFFNKFYIWFIVVIVVLVVIILLPVLIPLLRLLFGRIGDSIREATRKRRVRIEDIHVERDMLGSTRV
ncbi:protein hapless 2 like protein [Babesia gibsoni]|uniref:Protein hapless 2 like protein n=1 Tax=Babesia gibsoni TaxID=33632 RepID=A0AAD8PFL8_BABGI|nr:protein hapless 2 like protein [Babesia gibsoni]